jgi:hypothetical protein
MRSSLVLFVACWVAVTAAAAQSSNNSGGTAFIDNGTGASSSTSGTPSTTSTPATGAATSTAQPTGSASGAIPRPAPAGSSGGTTPAPPTQPRPPRSTGTAGAQEPSLTLLGIGSDMPVNDGVNRNRPLSNLDGNVEALTVADLDKLKRKREQLDNTGRYSIPVGTR